MVGELIASSYLVLALVTYSFALVLLARNFRNVTTRWIAATLLSYSVWAVVFYVQETTVDFEEALTGLGLFIRAFFFPFLYLSFRSFRGIEWYDFFSFAIPAIVLAYLLIFPPIGFISISAQLYYFEVIIPLFLAFLVLLNLTIYVGYRTYYEIADPVTRARFFYLALGFAIIGYIRVFEMFSFYAFGIVFTAVPHILGLAVVIYPFVIRPRPKQASAVSTAVQPA